MLGLILSFFLSSSGFSQTFTPVPYNLPDIPSSNSTGYNNYADPPADLIWVRSPLYSTSTNLPQDQFTLSNCWGWGGTSGPPGGIVDVSPWQSRIHFDGSSGSYRNVKITESNFTGWEIYATGIVNNFEISSSEFDRTFGNVFDLSTSSSSYGTITINANTLSRGPIIANGNGISLSGFSVRRMSTFDNIFLTNNSIDNFANNTAADGPFAAINLVATSAQVTGNTINGSGFQFGISNAGDVFNHISSNTLICNNIITNCGTYFDGTNNNDGGGIFTQYWDGIAKLNEVSNCDDGHQSWDNDNGRILYSRYFNNTLSGLKFFAGSSRIDLSGIHNSVPTDIAAFDTLDHNNTAQSTTQAQIVFPGGGAGATLTLGTSNTGTTTYAHNTIISNSSTDNLMYSYSSITLTKFNKNYWGTGTGAGTEYLLQSPVNDPLFPGIVYPATLEQNNVPYIVNITAACGDGLDPQNNGAHKGGVAIQSLEMDTSDVYCYNLTVIAHRYWEDRIPSSYQKGNDTLRLFIEQCGFKHYIQNYGAPWHAFDEIDGDVQGMDTNNNRWLEYRGWLEKVLYLNADTNYYCADVNSLMTTFQYLIPGKGEDYNGHIAIIDFLLNMNRCPALRSFLLQQRAAGRKQQLTIWRDSVHDSIATPIDTSSVTIDQIGFSILRGPQFGAVANKNNIHGLGNLVATKNPFTDATTLETEIGDAMMLRLEVLDVLGRQLYSENRFFSVGEVKWLLDGKGLPEGSLYARVSTINGDVRSIKLVRQ